MRILFAIASAEVGGAEIVFRRVAEGLRARGHACGLLVPAENRRRGTAEIDLGAFDAVHEVPIGDWARGVITPRSAIGEIRRGEDGHPWAYDVAALALLGPHLRRGLAEALPAGTPIVHVIHSVVGWSLWYTHGFYRGEPVAAVVTVERQTAAYVSDLWPGLMVRCIANGVEAPRGERRPGPRGPGLVGTLGRISPWAKHQIMFARVAGIVQSRWAHRTPRDGHPWASVPIFRVIGGTRPEERPLEDRLQKAAIDAGGRIEITGYLPPERAREELAQLDVFLLTSSSEGSPLALLEAMAEGLPCVATAVGGVPELLLTAGDGVPGIRPGAQGPRTSSRGALVAVDDDEAAAAAVEAYLADPALAAAHGATARAYVEREHTIEGMVDAYEALFADLAGRRRATES